MNLEEEKVDGKLCESFATKCGVKSDDKECCGRVKEGFGDDDEVDGYSSSVDNDRDLLERIDDFKRNHEPFVSAWESSDEESKIKNEVPKTLLSAAENGAFDALKEMIDRDRSLIMVRDTDEYTPLHRAAYNNHPKCVEYLLLAGADIEARSGEGWTPLHCAARWASAECLAILLSYSANVNAKSHNNLTPLHLVLSSEEPYERVFRTFRYLMESPGVDITIASNAMETPLMLARRSVYEIADYMERFANRP